MLVAMIFIALLLVFLGWGVHKKRWYFLISGYNMMSKEEQEKVDIEKLAKSVAYMLYILAILMVLLGILSYFELWTLLIVTTILIVVVPVVFSLRSNRYLKAAVSKKTKVITIIISGVTIIGVGIIFYFSLKPTVYGVDSDTFTIEGMYGETIAFTDITSVQLVEELPNVAVRSNGSSVGSMHKGYYKLENGDKVKLFVDEANPPFIKLETVSTTIYFNDINKDKTEKLFKQLQQ